ncbi:MAG: hypothetical protein LUE90_01195 [Clostridiales bacterium]|nr:hypothetical protein [Clostridiales bacterium]
MKKMRAILAAGMVAVLAVGLAACGSTESSSETAAESAAASGDSAQSAETSAQEADAYTVTIEGTTIVMNAEAAPIIESLGDDYSYFESESCAFEGLDKVYTYSGFKLNTYPVDDVDYVSSVVFMDDTVETDEGICIGSAKEDVTAAYGEADEETDSALIYEKGDSTLTIGISDGAVSSLEIAAVTE